MVISEELSPEEKRERLKWARYWMGVYKRDWNGQTKRRRPPRDPSFRTRGFGS